MLSAPIHRFYSDDAWIEGVAVNQLNTLARSSPAIRALASMPDLQPGKYGPTGIGMLSDEVHPEIVGSDIGCGMGLFRTPLLVRKFKAEKAVDRLNILDTHWNGDAAPYLEEAGLKPSLYDIGLGTIGSGNHFCEFQAIHEIMDPDAASAADLDKDAVFILVHSGSRALGHSIFDGYLQQGHGHIPADSERGAQYLTGHDHALAWAKVNRQLIAHRAAEAARTETTPLVDLSHNFLEKTGRGILHRKGAAPADRGLVPIPGSRETLSYLVKPLEGAPSDALACLAHGAGRKYDRGSMHGRVPNVKSVRERMTRNPFGGIIVCEDRKLMIEEAPDAYKNIERVIADLVSFGLISVVATFRPLLTFKTGQANIGARGREDRRK